MRPLDSVTGTRCTRCTPRSNLSRLHAPRPWMKRMTSLRPPTPVALASMISTFQRWRSAYFVYMRARSAANSAASSPPAPARISTKTFLSSLGSRGRSRRFSSSSSAVWRAGQLVDLGLRQLLQLAVAALGQDVAGLADAACRTSRYSREALDDLLRCRRAPCGDARTRPAGRRWRDRPARARSRATALRSGGACQTASRFSASRARTPRRGRAGAGQEQPGRCQARTADGRPTAAPSAGACTCAGSAPHGRPCP